MERTDGYAIGTDRYAIWMPPLGRTGRQHRGDRNADQPPASTDSNISASHNYQFLRSTCSSRPAHLHHPLPADSELCQAIAVLDRAHQDAICARTKAHHQLRSLLRDFFQPSWLCSRSRFPLGIASPEARAVLAIAPTPAEPATLSVSRIAAALKRAGRSRGIAETAVEIKAGLRKPNCANRLVETAMGKHALALLAASCTRHRVRMSTSLAKRPLNSSGPVPATRPSPVFPGLAESTGARVLAEIGDDRTRFADARALMAYAGSAPLTRASGRSISITHRHIKNNRLANDRLDVGLLGRLDAWASRWHYRRRRQHGDRHAVANRHLFNKLLGQLYHCLQNRQTFDEATAFHRCATPRPA